MLAPDFSTLTLDKSQALQPQLYKQLVEWICGGRLAAGCQLLSSRKMAEQLSISRNTVSQVLAQLKAEGFVVSHAGKGLFVDQSLPVDIKGLPMASRVSINHLPPISQQGERLRKNPGLKTRQKTVLPFTAGVPDVSLWPDKIWGSLYRRHQGRASLLTYDGPQGYLPLREALAHYLTISRGVRCNSQQIIITNGAQEALTLCAKVTLDHGDLALIEEPGYSRARQVLINQGAQLQGIELKNRSLSLAALEKFSQKKSQNKKSVKLLYTCPTHQYPMGGMMAMSERYKLLQWAADNNTWIIEDDYDSEFAFNQKPVAALQGMADNSPVLYMGSFSKTLFPSLRLGYLVVPESLVAVFSSIKNNLSGESCLLHQAVVADFISEGHFVRHLRKMRLHYKKKWQHLTDLLNKLGDKVELVADSAGMHLVITFKQDDKKVHRKLLEQGFGSTPLSSYYLNEVKQQGLVLGFSFSNDQQRIDLVNALDKIID